jgi:hypothetical protein
MRFSGLNKKAAIVCLLGLVSNFIACYPGYMTGDTIEQYRQSLTANYDDWHPPIMAAWWRCLNIISGGPQSMLAFQLLCLWLAIYFLYDLLRNNSRWFITVTLFALAPFLQNFSGYVIKDSQMAITWLLSCAWMLHISLHRRKPHFLEILACTALLVYGSWIRLNALPGFIPLCFLWSFTFFAVKSRGAKLAYAFLFLLISAIFQPLVNRNLLHAKKAYPEIKLYLHDLSGIYLRTGENVFPAELYANPEFDTAYIRKKYSITSFDPIWWNADSVHIIQGDQPKLNEVLKKAWQKNIRNHTGVYLGNRLEGFAYYLRIKNSGNHFYYNIDFIDPNPWNFAVSNNALHRFWQKGINLHGNMPYMRPWFWLALNVLLLFFAGRIRTTAFRYGYRVLLWSSLLYFLPNIFLFQVDFELRYSYWNCIACALAVVLLIAERLRMKNSRAFH